MEITTFTHVEDYESLITKRIGTASRIQVSNTLHVSINWVPDVNNNNNNNIKIIKCALQTIQQNPKENNNKKKKKEEEEEEPVNITITTE